MSQEQVDTTSEAQPTAVLTETELAAASDNHTHCLVCYSDLKTRGKSPCDHNDICGVCHLRLRHLHSDKKCPICKRENEHIIVSGDDSKPRFSDYPMWGDDIGPGFVHRQNVGMFFENEYFEQEIQPLFGYGCHQCDYNSEQNAHSKKHSHLRMLQDHLRSKHRQTLCSLCVDHKRDFVSRLPRMSPSQLQKHLKNGDGPGSGFNGHPLCEFCKPKRFYDLAFLHQHLHKDHYKCHVCQKQGQDNQFFKDYKSLERHFDRQHFLCHDVQCMTARFVVFESELDLRAHELSVHGGTSTGSTKINLEFRTRRTGYDGSGLEEQTAPSDSDFNYGLDGQAFVPEALPTTNEVTGGSTGQLHPLHLQRTEELRAQAAAIREHHAVSNTEEAFPTLETANGSSSAPLVGWASSLEMRLPKKEAGKVTEEDFPTLGPAPSANATAKKKALRGNIGATRRQFAAMTTSAAQPSSKGNWGSAAASRPTPHQTSNFLSPPVGMAPVNRQSDLTPNNFPALGPSMGNQSTTQNFSKKAAPRAVAPPSFNSSADFPSISAANQSIKPNAHSSVRNRVLGNGNAKMPSQQAMSNVLQMPNRGNLSSASAKATVEEMKGSLGPKKYKELKRLTREFAERSLTPEGYVDHSAALFDNGYADADFWAFVPSLLESCPNTTGSEQALVYMTTLKQQQYADKPAPRKASAVAAPPVAATWGKGNHRNNNVMKPSPTATRPTVARPNVLVPPVNAPRAFQPNVVASKKKGAWGSGGSATVVRAKASPGSAALAAAAAQAPKGGSATSYMAKQTKQQKQNASQANQKKNKAKKKKQNDELRALAFGGK